jgi:hypothetical protein
MIVQKIFGTKYKTIITLMLMITSTNPKTMAVWGPKLGSTALWEKDIPTILISSMPLQANN